LLKRLEYFLVFFHKNSKAQKIDLGKIFNPEKYGLLCCPDCKGKGKLPKDPHGLVVCPRCGGNGVVKKGKQAPDEGRK